MKERIKTINNCSDMVILLLNIHVDNFKGQSIRSSPFSFTGNPLCQQQ